MRYFLALVLVLAGCSSSYRRTAPGVTVTGADPTMPVCATPSPHAIAAVSADRPDPFPAPSDPSSGRGESGGIVGWLKSGRGLTWGAASRGPVRDAGLDGLMVDTLASGGPIHTREPSGMSGNSPPADNWFYPANSREDSLEHAPSAVATSSDPAHRYWPAEETPIAEAGRTGPTVRETEAMTRRELPSPRHRTVSEPSWHPAHRDAYESR
jgi:hypothetical protein